MTAKQKVIESYLLTDKSEGGHEPWRKDFTCEICLPILL